MMYKLDINSFSPMNLVIISFHFDSAFILVSQNQHRFVLVSLLALSFRLRFLDIQNIHIDAVP
jgi:E3 ubiquitin-protein ligase DOA10